MAHLYFQPLANTPEGRAEQWLIFLTAHCGDYSNLIAADDQNGNRVYVASFQDYPKSGLTSHFSYGLAEVQQIKNRITKEASVQLNEISLSVESKSNEWAEALLDLVLWNLTNGQLQAKALFKLGRVIEPAKSLMNSFLLFNSVSGKGNLLENIPYGGQKLSYIGAFPLYEGEVELLQKVGINKFVGLREYEHFSVLRQDLSMIYKVGG